MNRELPFDSIESTHEFVGLFATAVLESQRDIETDIQREKHSNVPPPLGSTANRRVQLETLDAYLTKTQRILNDLRSLRRLLFAERAGGALDAGPKSVATTKAETSPRPSTEAGPQM